MGKKPLIVRKWLAVGIILLFVGVTIAPSINQNVVTASQEDDLIEVTSQACGIQGYGDTTVKLTGEQYQNLEQYFVEFRVRLNQTTSREEAVLLFKDGVVELDTYGLLPKGMSVEQAQKLVVGRFQNERLMKLIERRYAKNQKYYGYISNRFCLIVGISNNTHFFGFPLMLPIKLFSIVTLGYSQWWNFIYGSDYFPAEGGIVSFGLSGIQKHSGNMHGTMHEIEIPGFINDHVFHTGIIGFTGIRLRILDFRIYFGFALKLSLRDW